MDPDTACRRQHLSILKALAECQTLTRLDLSFYHQDSDDIEINRCYQKDRFSECDVEPDNGSQPGGHLVVQELFKQKFNALESMQLRHAAFHIQDLQKFVANDPQLKRFQMENGKLGGCEQWCHAKAGSDISRWLTGHIGIEVRCQPHSNHWEQQDWSKDFREWRYW